MKRAVMPAPGHPAPDDPAPLTRPRPPAGTPIGPVGGVGGAGPVGPTGAAATPGGPATALPAARRSDEGGGDRRPLDPATRDSLVQAHLGLVHHLARRYRDRGEPYDDLVQVGTIGLIHAIDRYDASRGTSFAAFATPTILGEIRRHFRDRAWLVRVPRRLQELQAAITAARGRLSQDLGRSPTVHELADAVGADEEEVLEALDAAGAYSAVPLDPGDGSEPGAHLGAPDDGLALVVDREALRPVLRSLAPREKQILVLRYFRGMSQAEIAAEVGLSQMHVSRLLARILEQLRAGLDAAD